MIKAVQEMTIVAVLLRELEREHMVVPVVVIQDNGMISNSNRKGTLRRRRCRCTFTKGVVVSSSFSTNISNRSFKALESKRLPIYKSQELVCTLDELVTHPGS